MRTMVRVSSPLMLLALAGCSNLGSENGAESLGVSSAAITPDTSTIYTLTGVGSGKCIEPQTTANGANLQIMTCNGGTKQQWKVELVSTGWYRIKNAGTGYCVNIASASTADGAAAVQWTCDGSTNNQFSFTDLGAGAERITPKHSSKSLDVVSQGTVDGTLVDQWTYNAGTNQQFKLIPYVDPTATYKIINVNANKCVDAMDTASNTQMKIYGCGATSPAGRQQWVPESVGGGNYRLRNTNSNLCMAISSASTADGAADIQWACNTSTNSYFSFTDVDNGALRLTPQHATTKALEVPGGATADGSVVDQWAYGGGAHQKFKMTPTCAYTPPSGSPVDLHGRLSTVGNRIKDKNGADYAPKGVSSFWMNDWSTAGAGLENLASQQYVRDNWKVQVVRAAMGTEAGNGYLTNPTGLQARVDAVVQSALQLGLYVIVDWHTELAVNQQSQAVSFFTNLANTYGGCPNIIYEDYNEPNGFTWAQIKPYHTAVVSAIRSKDPDNLIIMGTPNWSQGVDDATLDPVAGTNLAYTLHFYACSHTQWLRDKANTALGRGYPLFVTEFGITPADGGVAPNNIVCETEGNNWFSWMATNKIGGASWKFIIGGDSSNFFKSGTSTTGPYPDSVLTTTAGPSVGHALFVVNWLRQ